MYVISATLSDDARHKALDKILNGITAREGEIVKIHEQGRRRLAYEIDGHREGSLFPIFYFNVNPEVICEIMARISFERRPCAFITLRADKVMEKIEFKPLLEKPQ